MKRFQPSRHYSYMKDLRVTSLDFASAECALEALAEELDGKCLGYGRQGPKDLGVVSFLQPETQPPAVFFVRGTHLVTIASIGSEGADVLSLARRIDHELMRPPEMPRSVYRAMTGRGTL